jgi:hypothetical protein
LLFVCPISNVIWGFFALCFHQKDMPSNYDQFWQWIEKTLPDGQRCIHALAAIYWVV